MSNARYVSVTAQTWDDSLHTDVQTEPWPDVATATAIRGWNANDG